MYTKQEIILRSHRDGFSHRQITRDLGISHKTVSKYISQYNLLLSSGKIVSQALSVCLSEPPAYNSNTTILKCIFDVVWVTSGPSCIKVFILY